jgi:hypothetical protein
MPVAKICRFPRTNDSTGGTSLSSRRQISRFFESNVTKNTKRMPADSEFRYTTMPILDMQILFANLFLKHFCSI